MYMNCMPQVNRRLRCKKAANSNIAAESFRCDFEDAAIKSFKDAFPTVGTECSLYNFAQDPNLTAPAFIL